MSTKPASSLRLTLFAPEVALTLEDRLRVIDRMHERISGHVQFMCRIASLEGSSVEAKEQAVTAFHDRMIALEHQLDRIHEEVQLG